MSNYSDLAQRKLIIKLFSVIGFLTTSFMSVMAFWGGLGVLSLVLVIASICFVISFVVTAFLQKRLLLASTTILYTIYILMFYLVLTGGSHGTGPLWIYVVAPITFFIRGFKKGIIDIFCFVLAILYAFHLASTYQLVDYGTLHFPSRIILTFIIVAALSGLYEYFRQHHSEKLTLLAQKNELLATIDPLTNLPNRRSMMAKLAELKSNDVNPVFSIILLDVDDFKKINDQYGHFVGDHALTHLADIFTQQLTHNDLVARWGGEEFLFVLPNKNKAKALQLTDTLHGALKSQPLHIDGYTISITVSMGIAEITDSSAIERDIQHADALLYQAKNSGKNRTCA
ncbi:GGDEF domain-containing protein [Pseudoalteromonas sp. NEC-BIFX-2020_015]|uniref:diguanylate cyclase n=1 Tax=Pseudoalteromonas sp. NEC-BIFX-2020_015 TaxID=2729544 RepID=UPI00146164C7|nr:GGDEF domain-containing protein [Pseudoalteromonas sp. NEC-BIFX-2020_015]